MSLGQFSKNAILYSFGSIVARGTTFILIPLYSQNFSVSDFGLLFALLSTIQVLSVIIDFGVLNSLMRFTSSFLLGKREGELLGSAYMLNIISGVFVFLLSLLLLPPLFHSILKIEDVFKFVLLSCLVAFTQSLTLNFIAYFRARNQGIWFTALSLFSALLVLSLNFIFIVLLKYGVDGALYAYILAYLTISILTLIKHLSRMHFSFKYSTFKLLVQYGFPLIFARAGDIIFGATAIYILTYFVGLEEVGFYTLANKIAMIIGLVLILPFQRAYEPYVFSKLNDQNISSTISKITTYLVLLFFILSFTLVFILPNLLKVLAPPEYSKSYLLIILLLPIQLFTGFQYIGQSLLHINKKSNITGTIIGLITILSIGLNYFFIGIVGAGVYGLILAANSGSFLMAFLLFYFGNKEFPVKLQYLKLAIITFVFTIAISSVVFLKDTNSIIYYSLPPVIFLSCIYGFYRFNLFEYNAIEFVFRAISKFKNKFWAKSL